MQIIRQRSTRKRRGKFLPRTVQSYRVSFKTIFHDMQIIHQRSRRTIKTIEHPIRVLAGPPEKMYATPKVRKVTFLAPIVKAWPKILACLSDLLT